MPVACLGSRSSTVRRRSSSVEATLAPSLSGPFCIARTGDASRRFDVSAAARMSSSPIAATSPAFAAKAGEWTSSSMIPSTYSATLASRAGTAAASIGTMPSACAGATAVTGGRWSQDELGQPQAASGSRGSRS